MTMISQNFVMWQGEDKTLRIPIVDGDGDPVNLTGSTVRWEMFKPTADPVAVKTTGDGITLYNAAGTNDGIQIEIDPADTTDVTDGEYSHECRVTDGAGNKAVVFVGLVTLYYSETLTVEA